MKEKILKNLVFGIIILSAFYFLKSENDKNLIFSSVNSYNSITSKSRIPLKELKFIKSEDSKSIQTKISKSKLLPPECDEFLSHIAYLKQDELLSEIKNKKIFINDMCYKKLLDIKPVLLEPKCHAELEKNEKALESCTVSLFFLKSLYIADQAINETATTMTDSELASFAVKAFFSLNDKMSKLDFENNLEYFEEFHTRFPEDSRVIEAYAGYMMIGSKVTGYKEYLSEVDGLLKDFEGKDFKVDRLQVIQHVANDDYEKAKQALNHLEKYYAHEAEFDYYRAAYAWKLKDMPGQVL